MNRYYSIPLIFIIPFLVFITGCWPTDDGISLITIHNKTEMLQGPFQTASEVTLACLNCHKEAGNDFIQTIHWNWRGPSPNMAGHENENINGKLTTINNFCISPNSNQPKCAQCHTGYGQVDNDFDFNDQSKIDCLICHEQTGNYKKDSATGGMPIENTDLVASARSVRAPDRENCGVCHFFSGGGDNAKKGDLSSLMMNPDENIDVHMGRLDFQCQTCHKAPNHKIKGSSIHIGLTYGRISCIDCHKGKVHNDTNLDKHTESVACQTCHIPAFSRTIATKIYWNWSKAGKRDKEGNKYIIRNIDNYPIYDSEKGELFWKNNIRPEYAWWNGKFTRLLAGDKYIEIPINLASPIGDIKDKDAKIYPFKVMRGRQPVDPVNKTMLILHASPSFAGENPFWEKWDWNLAFTEGMASVGLDYSGTYEWAETFMYMVINHEIPPKSKALRCMDCHNGGIDFKALGYEGDPIMTGGRFQ